MSHSHTIPLPGCTPVPLAGYLKSLGVFRLLSMVPETNVRGFWQNEHFTLQTSFDAASMFRFFLYDYRPTPLMAPWNGGSGFYTSDNQESVEKIRSSDSERFGLYRQTIETVQSLLVHLDIHEKPIDDAKMNLLMACRNELADEVVEWLDAVAMLTWDDPKFPPLVGTGGNDGRLEFTNNFMKNLTQLFDPMTGSPSKLCQIWLRSALLGEPARGMEKSAIGQFAPGQAGGPNATSGFTADSLINPWDYVLMMEGILVFAAAATRKHEKTSNAIMSYPFTVLPAGVGNGSTSDVDESSDQARAEMWMPIWQRPTSFAEIEQIFREGRVQVKRHARKGQRNFRSAVDGIDFARACATLAVDRGIQGFQRYAFMKRAGKSYLAVPLTRFAVRSQPEANLLSDLDEWIQTVEDFCKASDIGCFKQALRRIKSSMFELSEFGGTKRVQKLLIDLAAIERLCVKSPRARETIQPLILSNEDWLRQAADGSDEWAIATALASLYQTQGVLPLRAYFSPIDPQKPWKWSEDEHPPSVVWGTGNVILSMTNVLHRRVMDWRNGRKDKAKTELGESERNYVPRGKPLDGSIGIDLVQLQKFLNDETGLRNSVGDLLWGLLPFTTNGAIHRYAKWRRESMPTREQTVHRHPFLPWTYVLSRLVVSSHLTEMNRSSEANEAQEIQENSNVAQVFRIQDNPEIPIPGSLISMLVSNRVKQAARIAEQRLIGSGFQTRMKGLGNTNMHGRDIAAALLIPLRKNVTATLRDMAILQAEAYDQNKGGSLI